MDKSKIECRICRLESLLSDDPIIKHFVRYTELHRNRVKKLINRLGIPITYDGINTHDLDKYSPRNLKYYSEYHYLKDNNKEIPGNVQANYDDCHNDHIHSNDHHPQYWYDKDPRFERVDISTFAEMICDWISAGWTSRTLKGEEYEPKMLLDYYNNVNSHIFDKLPYLKDGSEKFMKDFAKDGWRIFNEKTLRDRYDDVLHSWESLYK